MVIVRISFVCALVRACVEPRGAPNRANESALHNSRAYATFPLCETASRGGENEARESKGESKVSIIFLRCIVELCGAVRIVFMQRRNEKLFTLRRQPKMLEVFEDSKIVRQCERIGNETDRRWIRKKMKMIKKKKGRKKKMKNRIIITNGVVKFKIVE